MHNVFYLRQVYQFLVVLQSFMFKRDKIPLWIMGAITLIGFPLVAWPLLWFQDIPWISLIHFDISALGSIFIMLAIGLLFGLFIIFLTEIPYFDNALSHIKNRLANFKLNTFFVFFLSIAAGIGEEVFFRGALQPLIGIYFTSLIFVAIHGYFSFKNMAINLFGGLLFIFICLLGFMASKYSIWHAIAAHFSYDLVLLFYYKNLQQNEY